MRIIVTGGGTAGHVTPLLAVASELHQLQPDAHIRYIGKTGDSMASSVRAHAAIEKEYKIQAGKLRRFHGKPLHWYLTQPKLVFHNLKDALLVAIGCVQSLLILLIWRPDVVFVKGGYVGLPVGLMAVLLRIPILTHDSDAHPGLTNRILSRYAAALAVGAPVTAYPGYKGKNVHFTGVPVREDFLHPMAASAAKRKLGISPEDQVVAIVGGSLGAVRVNDAVLNCLEALTTDKTFVYWLTGAISYDDIERAVQNHPSKNKVVVKAFSDELPVVFAAATVVVTRAGATTLAELAVMHKPCIIIPNPLLTGGHQVKNAQLFAGAQAALVISEDELAKNPSTLAQKAGEVIKNTKLQHSLGEAIAAFAVASSARQIAELILKTGKRKDRA